MSPRMTFAVAFAVVGLAATDAAAAEGEYRLERLPVLSRVLLSVHDNYVDPSRIEPRRMAFSALVGVEKAVPEVVVHGDADSQRLTILVGASSREVDLSGVDSIWKVRTALGDALVFVQEHLVSEVDPRAIEYAAVNGMLSTLDPRTGLLEPRAFREMRTNGMNGPAAGIGLVFAVREGNLTVVKAQRDAPARRAGLLPGDVITEIDGRSMANIDLQDAVERMRGKPQSTIALVVVRPGWSEPRRFELTREPLRVPSIGHVAVLDGGIGYVRVSQFSTRAATELTTALATLARRAGGTLRGLALDLRGCQGGLLEETIRIADLFLDHGVIVKISGDGRKQRIREVKEATAEATDVVGVPLVVLVDGRTAAGAEIVTSALKENGRAVVVGRQTFGQDTIQVLHDFASPGGPPEEPGALRLTIARFWTGADASVREIGIRPDVLLRSGRALKEQVSWFAPQRAPGEPVRPTPMYRDPAALELRYLLERQEEEDLEADPEHFVEDQPIRFARELLSRAPVVDRSTLLEAARALVAARRD